MGSVTEQVWREKFEERKTLYLKNPLEFYDERYFRKRLKMRAWEMEAGKIVSNLFDIKSMIDFGCAWGSYLEGALTAKTKKVLGVDICYDHIIKYVPEHVKKFIIQGNVASYLNYGKWDCAFSIETAEHLLPKEIPTYLENLKRASSRLIIMTAAASYNLHHLNPATTREYWTERLVNIGCTYLPKEGERLAKAWRAKRNIGRRIRKTIMVFNIRK